MNKLACEIRLRSADTRRWRAYEIDIELDPEIMQGLNDLAFLFGVEIVATCAGHDVGWNGDERDIFRKQESFAQVRFAARYPYGRRLECQRARLCATALAEALAGEGTVVEMEHHKVVDPRVLRRYREGRWFLTASYNRPTAEDPVGAKAWWGEILKRVTAHLRHHQGHGVLEEQLGRAYKSRGNRKGEWIRGVAAPEPCR